MLAYIGVLRMDPFGVLLAFGLAMVGCGLVYRTPIPVQASRTIGMMSRRKLISRVAALATAAAVTWGTLQAPAQADA